MNCDDNVMTAIPGLYMSEFSASDALNSTPARHDLWLSLGQ